MIPYLIEIGPIKIPSYGFMLMVAFMVNYYLLTKELKRLGKDPEMAGDAVFWAAIGGIVGSKIYYMAENFRAFSADPLGMIFSGSGLVFFGGLAGGMLAVTFYIKKKNEPWLAWADMVSPLLILGYAIGRIGCFLVGDDYGVVTDLPWGMTFPKGAPPTLVPVHPTQVYETVMGIGIFAILWKLRTVPWPHGRRFALYLMLAGTERLLIEFIRTNNEYLLGLSGAQIISICMFIIGITLINKLGKASHDDSASGAET